MRPVRAGRLRQVIYLMRPTEADGADGDPDVSYEQEDWAYAAVEPLIGRSLFVAQQVLPDVTHTVEVRAPTPLTARWRIALDARVFELGPPLDTEERGRQVRFTAVEVVP